MTSLSNFIYHSVEVSGEFRNTPLQLMKMSHLVVRTLSVQTCVFISSVFVAGDRDSHKHTKSRKEKRRND